MNELKLLIQENKNSEFKEKLEIILQDKSIYSILDVHGENLLHWAGAYNNPELCEYLIKDKKLHVNLQNFRSATPLYYAAMQNSKEAVIMLLKYHANPCIRSGFSGEFPSESTNNLEIRDLLHQAENLIPLDYNNQLKVKYGRSLYLTYNYRLYMNNLADLNYLTNILPEEVKQRYYGGFYIPKLKPLFDEHGIEAVAIYVQQSYEQYYNFIETEKTCLYCHKIATKRCSKCHEVYFCDSQCQRECLLFHKYDCN